MKVDLDQLDACLQTIAEVNAANLEDIVWVRNGEQVVVPEDQVKYWRDVGLTNLYFYKLVLKE